MVNKYYSKRKERLQKELRGRYQNLSEEEKDLSSILSVLSRTKAKATRV